MKQAINWLHISDLHYSGKVDAAKAEQDNKMEILLEDVERRIRTLGRIEFVLFSGDLVHHGDEYEFLNEQIEKLYSRISNAQGSSDLPPLLPVPGNHDVTRPVESAFKTIAEKEQWNDEVKQYFDASKLIDPRFWQQDEIRESKFFKAREFVNSCFENYSAWAKSNQLVPSNLFDQGNLIAGDFSYVREINGFKVGILGLNSSFLQLDKGDFEGNLELCYLQANRVVSHSTVKEWAESNHFNILMTHQPLSWLKKESKADLDRNLLTQNKFPVHVSGHLHTPSSEMISFDFGPTSTSITAPSLSGMEYFTEIRDHQKIDKIERIHGYNICQLTKTDDKKALIKMSPRILRFVENDVRAIPDFRFDLDDSNGKLLTKKSLEIKLFKDWPSFYTNVDNSHHREEAVTRIESSTRGLENVITQDFVSLMSRAIVRTDSLVQFSPFSNKTTYQDTSDDCQNLVIATISSHTDPTQFAEPKLSRRRNYKLSRLKTAKAATDLLDEIESCLGSLTEAGISPDLLAINELAFPLLASEIPQRKSLLNRSNRLFKNFAKTTDCTVIAGSYHNDNFYNVAPIFGRDGFRFAEHSRTSNPFDYDNVVRTPSNQKLINYPYKHGSFSILLCRDSYDPKMLFKLVMQHDRKSKANDLSVIFVLALTTNKEISDKLMSACNDLSLISGCAVCYVNSSTSIEREHYAMFIGGHQCSSSNDSPTSPFVKLDTLHDELVCVYRIKIKSWKTFQDEQLKSRIDQISQFVKERGQPINSNISVFATGNVN